ncbi:hypothetical protein [Pseudactinotalea sp. Z1732]|uniref:hypothetical protein n=1 Tax=Micrococcales TaxID=85006 RepID=UPI003C79BE01
MTCVFVLGKPAERSPTIAAAIQDLRGRGIDVRTLVPEAASAGAGSSGATGSGGEAGPDDGAWRVDGKMRLVRQDLTGARLIAQRGLAPEVLDLLTPWARRCCNDPVATALTHRRAVLLDVLARAGLAVPRTSLEPDYQDARAAGAVIKAADARAGRGAGVLLPGTAPAEPPFPGPYLLQEHLEGWEAKMYVFGAQVRSARRPGGRQSGGEVYTPAADHADLARAAAGAVGVELCGVDLMITADGPVVIDVNAFPSATKIPGAAGLIAAHLVTRL